MGKIKIGKCGIYEGAGELTGPPDRSDMKR